MNYSIVWIYSERASFALQKYFRIAQKCSQEYKIKWPQTFRTEPGLVYGSVCYNIVLTTLWTRFYDYRTEITNICYLKEFLNSIFSYWHRTACLNLLVTLLS